MKQMTDVGLDLGKWLGGAAAGALLMYMLDPDRGSTRRAYTTDRLRDVGRQGGSALSNAWENIGSRVSSVAETAAESARHLAKPDGPSRAASDSMSRMSRQASGAVSDTMSRAGEIANQATSRMKEAMHAGGGNEWAPGLRGSAMVGGGLLGLYGLMRRSPLGWAVGLAGAAMLARGLSNQPLRSMLGGRGLERTIDFEKSIHIDASPDEVYDLWSNYENFPRFMSHVVEVRDMGGRRSRWVVRGPAGAEFEWNSVLTEQSRPRRLAWRSEPGAEIPNSGSIQFEPSRGGTLVTVRMSYTPPAGMIGHGIASLLGADPKREMDDDLARMKAFIERGGPDHEMRRQSKGFISRLLH
jgi:uncharacterized membrane protein